MMADFTLTVMALLVAAASAYIPHSKEPFLMDGILREIMDRMGKDITDAAAAYLDFPDTNGMPLERLASARAADHMEPEEQPFPVNYERLMGNPNPSIRDQEYLQHSSLWGQQHGTGSTASDSKQKPKPEGTAHGHKETKTDATLPAYCNPPNPCPVGYGPDDGCLEHFENTAVFSREYQASQECMCDSEHMFECSSPPANDLTGPEIDHIMEQFQVKDQHKSLVAKKFHIEKDPDANPFLRGEKLPVAAKKGNNVVY